MTPVDRDDPILRRLSRLAMPAPDPERSDRVIARGRAKMTGPQHRLARKRRFASIYDVLHWRGAR
jgi:hypothetical protein